MFFFLMSVCCRRQFSHRPGFHCSLGTKLSEDSRKYGSENTCTNGNVLTRAALNYGRARAQMEKERGNMLKALGTQVCLSHQSAKH